MAIRSKQIRAGFIVFLALMLSIVPLGQTTAGVQSLDHIRVSLFIKARGTVPSVTLESEKGLEIGTSVNGTFHVWKNFTQVPVRFTLDQFHIVLADRLSKEQAEQLASQARPSAANGEVYIRQGTGNDDYSVVAAGYESEQAASATLKSLSKWAENAKIVSPYYVAAGTYTTEEEAKSARDQLRAGGTNAVLVIHSIDEGTGYSVWIEGISQESDLNALREKIGEHAALDQADLTQPYAVIESELHRGQAVQRLRIGANDQAITIRSSGGFIKVEERFGRSYRGEMEVLSHQSKLALINVLPFEQYLYSVVGSEMGTGWPLEALKAQAVTARTFALKQGVKYNIAHVSDTTYEQSYQGVAREADDVIAAVDATKGEVIVDQDGVLITPFYSSNAGGMTADASEVWSNDLSYLKSVPSPDDGPQKHALMWHRVMLSDGKIGYIRSDYTAETGEMTKGGLKKLKVAGNNVNVRPAPFVNNTINGPIAQVNDGDPLILLESRIESNNYQWITVPYRAADLKSIIEARANMKIDGPLTSLQVTKRGPSARVMEVTANGQVINVSSPDAYRSVLNNLRSTRFDVEESANFTVLGAGGVQKQWPIDENPHVISAHTEAVFDDQMLALNPGNGARLLTREPTFTFIGYGYGHGVGMSQWGARELAEFMSFDYQQILQYYYNGIRITKP